MDIKLDLGFRKGRLKLYTVNGDHRYDYERFGFLDKVLPKILFKGNSMLVTFLQIIEQRFIMMMKTIKKIEQFKYISLYE